MTFNKDASANTKDAYKISATSGTQEVGVKTVTYSEDGKSALIETYTYLTDKMTYSVSCGELSGSFTASVGEVATITISTMEAQQNVKTPIVFTLFDANGIDVTPSTSVDSTCVITLSGTYVTAEKDQPSKASVTMGTIGDKVDVTITYNKGTAGFEAIAAKQTITCVAPGQTLGNAVFTTATGSLVNNKSECAKFYLGLSDKIVAVAENKTNDDVYFCAKDDSGAVISYDKYDVDSSNDDVATVTVSRDSGKYLKLSVRGNSVGSANLNISASKNGVATAYSIPVQVSKGTIAVKMVATAKYPIMSNVKDDDYRNKIEAKLYDANGNEVEGQFTFTVSKRVSDTQETFTVDDKGVIEAQGATPGAYAVKVTGSENIDNSYAFEQNVPITVKGLPEAAYTSSGSGINVTYRVELSRAEVDENPSFKKKDLKDTTTAKLYAMYDGLFAGYVNADGSVSDEEPASPYSILGTAKGIRVASASAISAPAVTVKFGNQYYTNIIDEEAALYDPATNTTRAAVTSQASFKSAVSDGAIDVKCLSVTTTGAITYGDATSKGALLWSNVARLGQYTVEYYYFNADGKFVNKPTSTTFNVKNTLTMPIVTVTSKKVPSFEEYRLKEVMKASVDMNNNASDHESIISLSNGTDNPSGVSSTDGLKITYKYALVQDNYENGTWTFYVPINSTFSYQ